MTTTSRWRKGFARWYVPFLFAIWAFEPEIRRVVDWHSGFHQISFLSVVPLIALLPGLALVQRNWRRLGALYRTVALLWIIGFAYAFIIAASSGAMISGIYAAALFLLPMFIGFSLISFSDDDPGFYDRTAAAALIIASITSLYGLYQFVAAPAWDIYWAEGANIASIGTVEPYSFRIWGTLNAPAPFATWLLFAIVLNLPRFKPSGIWRIVLVAPCLVALFLTSVRTAWIGLAIAVLVYVVLSPRRASFLATGAIIATLAAALIGALVTLNSGGAFAQESISERVATFMNLSGDESANIRARETEDAMHLALSEPLGQGLGTIGTAAKLGSGNSTVVLDSGYLSRFDEMGFAGFAFYLLALIVALFGSYQQYRARMQNQDRTGAAFVAMSLATRSALLIMDLSSDVHLALPAIFFWLSLYLVYWPIQSTVNRESAIDGRQLRVA